MLEQILVWILVGGGGITLAYLAMEKIKWLRELDPGPKRNAALALGGLAGVLAFLGNVAMLYTPQPANWREWVSSLVAAAMTASTLNQWLHGRLQLRKKSRIG